MSLAPLLGLPGKTKTLLDRLTSARASNLDNLDATVSSRAPASTALSTAVWTGTKAGYLDSPISDAKGASWDAEDFTSSGTWLRPNTNVLGVFILLVGGGGGGGSSRLESAGNAAGGGGGAGEYRELHVSVAGNVTVTIGSAGTGGTGTNDGGDGGTTSFGSHDALGGGGGGLGRRDSGTSNASNIGKAGACSGGGGVSGTQSVNGGCGGGCRGDGFDGQTGFHGAAQAANRQGTRHFSGALGTTTDNALYCVNGAGHDKFCWGGRGGQISVTLIGGGIGQARGTGGNGAYDQEGGDVDTNGSAATANTGSGGGGGANTRASAGGDQQASGGAGGSGFCRVVWIV